MGGHRGDAGNVLADRHQLLRPVFTPQRERSLLKLLNRVSARARPKANS